MTGATPARADQPNRDGLTYFEWCRAADPAEAAKLSDVMSIAEHRRDRCEYVDAWLAGEDPTEWRAARATNPQRA